MPIDKDIEEPTLALIIPCYNEVLRLEKLFIELHQFSERFIGDLSIVLIDDGSTDGTLGKIKELTAQYFTDGICKVIHYTPNRGKGYALQQGIAQAKASWLLTLDADLSAHPNVFLEWIENGDLRPNCIYVGSREHPASKLEFSRIRRMSGRLFNLWIRLNTGIKLKDTQCGFKCYPKSIGKQLFRSLKNYGWAHDVEILYRAKRLGLNYKALPLTWKHEENSKLSLLADGIGSALEIRAIRKSVDIELQKKKSDG